MNYTKPEVVLNVNASKVIMGIRKSVDIQLDANQVDFNATQAAYEADE